MNPNILQSVTGFFCISSTIVTISASGSSIDSLQRWLETEPAERPALVQPFSTIPLTKEKATTARQLLLEDHFEQLEAELSGEWEDREFTHESFRMKFDYRTFGEPPEEGRSLFISMHGGGNAPKETNDQQWENQITLYQPPEGIYLSPRAPTDTWNMWFQDHIDPLFKKIIRSAVLFLDVNPNRVYCMGYSAGGDGAYQMGPRMADHWAAAAAMAGHPNASSPVSLRNIGFTVHVGAEDAAYDRNLVAVEWKNKLDSLQKDDPEGYVHEVEVHEGYGHWMELEDAVAIPWMMQFTRDPLPERIAWHLSDVPVLNFYWIGIPSSQTEWHNEIFVRRTGQQVDVESTSGIDNVTIYFNDDMMDLDKEITVSFEGRELYTGMVPRTIGTIYATVNERSDREMVFSGKLDVDLKEETVAVVMRKPQAARSDIRSVLFSRDNGEPVEISVYSPAGRLLHRRTVYSGHSIDFSPLTQPFNGCGIICVREGGTRKIFRVIGTGARIKCSFEYSK